MEDAHRADSSGDGSSHTHCERFPSVGAAAVTLMDSREERNEPGNETC